MHVAQFFPENLHRDGTVSFFNGPVLSRAVVDGGLSFNSLFKAADQVQLCVHVVMAGFWSIPSPQLLCCLVSEIACKASSLFGAAIAWDAKPVSLT
mmetsp:Transcript_30356/g.56919  ORF Transcript_30356/g.56919 Transcript_30356/m.56919 type:complete len:96 (+) Transcript_30356:1264-1551(+)